MDRVGAGRRDDILLLGMNEHPEVETKALEKSNPSARVTLLRTSPQNGQLEAPSPGGGTQVYDLGTDAGIRAFVSTLELPLVQTRSVATVLSQAVPNARDELAQLAQVWARAEKGGVVPDRLVFSGHSNGLFLWGGNRLADRRSETEFKNGSFAWSSIEDLAAALPRAAAQVEDLYIAACRNGGESDLKRWQSTFPNLKTVAAYAESAPATTYGSPEHMSQWEVATRGEVKSLRPDLTKGLPFGESLAVWSLQNGYQTATVQGTTDEFRARHTAGRATFERYLSGEEPVRDPQSGPLYDYYNVLQGLRGRTNITQEERKQLELEIGQTLRLRFYKDVTAHFQREYQADIQQGFAALGRSAPDFSRLSRAEALKHIQAFETELARRHPRPEAAQRLLPLLTEGLRDLSSSRIPETWT